MTRGQIPSPCRSAPCPFRTTQVCGVLVDTVLTVKKDDDGGSRTFRNYVFFFVVVLVSKVRAYKRAATGNNNKG